MESMRASGKLIIVQVDAAEISPGEFAHKVRKAVDDENIRTVVIDSLNGYQNAMPQEQYSILHMHELLQYLNRVGATTFIQAVAQHGMVGDMKSPVDVTYLADTVILLRYFEAFRQVRRAISMLKKRTGAHENTIREFTIGHNGPRLAGAGRISGRVARSAAIHRCAHADNRRVGHLNTVLDANSSKSLYSRRRGGTRLSPPALCVRVVLLPRFAMT